MFKSVHKKNNKRVYEKAKTVRNLSRTGKSLRDFSLVLYKHKIQNPSKISYTSVVIQLII